MEQQVIFSIPDKILLPAFEKAVKEVKKKFALSYTKKSCASCKVKATDVTLRYTDARALYHLGIEFYRIRSKP